MKKLLQLLIIILSLNQLNAQTIYEAEHTSLASNWDINEENQDRKGYEVRQYKPLYVLLANFTNDINSTPSSDSPNHSVTTPIPLDNAEMKFQLSFKTKVVNDLFGSKQSGDLWVAYTQTSRWQIFNGDISRPFRETNYEPELMYIIPTEYEIFGFRGVFAGIGFNHQSNGRANPLSRSWNRIIIQAAWENDNTSIVLKPWFRVQEDIAVDDNPGVENYLGRTELMVAYGKGRHHLAFTGRHSLRFGENNRGNMQIDYSVRLFNNFKLFAQLFHGYGESMIDFNHRQTTFGLGVSLVEWR